MEMGCAVISGNLPLLRPYFDSYFRVRGNTFFTKSSSSSLGASKNNSGRLGGGSGGTRNLSHMARGKIDHEIDGFERIGYDGAIIAGRDRDARHGSDVELCDRTIMVKTDLMVTTESIKDEE
jgi:hypothetical protein